MQRRIHLLKLDHPDLEKVLIGQVQYRWQAGNGASKLYRYRKQIGYLVFCKDGSRGIMIDIGDESVTPTRKVDRDGRNKKLNKQSAPNAATDVYYYDANGYSEKQVERKTAPGRVLAPEGRLPDAGQHGGGVGGTDGRHATPAVSERALRSAGCADGAEPSHLRSVGRAVHPDTNGAAGLKIGAYERKPPIWRRCRA